MNVVSDQEVFDCPDLYSTQEEADTRMILQALHADKRLKEPSMTRNTFVWAVTLVGLDGVFYVIPVKYICYCMCFCKA
jgi:hypothetical protein